MYTRIMLCLVLLLCWQPARAEPPVYRFGVLSQRSAVLTAEYWNPILAYVGRKAGLELVLHITRTAPESNAAIARGEYDFVYSNTIFQPGNAPQGYQVIARPRDAAIAGQIVTLAHSPIRQLADLEGKLVGFPSRTAFVGYVLPMDQLLRAGVTVLATFGGNQEGIMAQLKAGRIVAAGVNNQVMQDYARREGLAYRVLWESPAYLNLPIAAHPRVPAARTAAVRQALVGMDKDPEGAAILAAAAKRLLQTPPYGFLAATQKDYANYVDFYRETRVRDIE